MLPLTYEDENDALLQSYLERTFFAAWKETDLATKKANEGFYGNYRTLELGLNSICDLNCKYCYTQKFGKEYFPGDTEINKDKILKNVSILLDWLWENRYHPRLEIFSGDPLIQTLGQQVIDLILTYAENGKVISSEISVPSNMSVLLHPEKLDNLYKLLERGKKCGVKILISASVDGPFMEENRPFRNPVTYKRTPEFYDRMFAFAKEQGLGFHPMVYSNNIHLWKDNFLWFQENYKKYDIPWWNLYLLEIRNQEWTVAQCKELQKFTRWLVNWVWQKCGCTERTFKFGQFFNILGSPLGTIGRGIGCSIQASIQTRMGDLSWGLCHRLLYDKYINGEFKVENDKIVGVTAKNIEAWLGVTSMTTRNFPHCEMCTIKNLCSAGCLGSNFETTGDIFSTPPSVCRMEHYKILGILEGLEDVGMLTSLMSRISFEKQTNIKQLLNIRNDLGKK